MNNGQSPSPRLNVVRKAYFVCVSRIWPGCYESYAAEAGS